MCPIGIRASRRAGHVTMTRVDGWTTGPGAIRFGDTGGRQLLLVLAALIVVNGLAFWGDRFALWVDNAMHWAPA